MNEELNEQLRLKKRTRTQVMSTEANAKEKAKNNRAESPINAHSTNARDESTKPAGWLVVDPVLPKNFYFCPNEERDALQLAQWWGRPYAESREDGHLNVWCLDGGCWDRPTWWGEADNYQAAMQLAVREWLNRYAWSMSTTVVSKDGKRRRVEVPTLVLTKHLPSEQLSTFDEVIEWLKANYTISK